MSHCGCVPSRHTVLPGYGFGFPYLGWPAYVAQPCQTQPCASVGIITPDSLTMASGIPFTQTLVAMGGMAPYTFSVHSGDLPDGIVLTSTGELSGTPTALPGTTYCFTIRARDASGLLIFKPYQGTL